MFILENIKEFSLIDRIAAVSENEGSITYAELESRSEAMAAFLLEMYPDKSPIILSGDKEHDMLTGVLAALKAGKPYVIVPHYLPQKRVQQIIDDCEPCAVFNVSDIDFPISFSAIYNKKDISLIIRQYSGKPVDSSNWVKPDDLVCIFYTSGSTGIPKGVMITRKNIQAMVDMWFPIRNIGINNPKMINFSPYAFASSLGTIYTHMGMLGATLYAVDKKLAANYPMLLEYVLEVNPHYFHCTPSFADICLQDDRFNGEYMSNIRQFSIGGEPLPHRIAKSLLEKFPNIQVMNGYGATETTIGTITCEVTWDMVNSDKPMPIGYPSFNSECLICDENENELPDGEIGELVIISDMITKGYFKDPTRTERSYFVSESGTRGYHTKDLAWKENGLIYYVGRADNMVKVGGYRVEMEEVERYLSKVSIVAQCAVCPAEEDQRTVMLVAYVVLKPGVKKGLAAVAAIKKEMAPLVPGYMIPQKIVFLDALPHNASDKLDRNKLREMSKIKK